MPTQSLTLPTDWPVGPSLIDPRPMGSRAVLVRLSFPEGVDSQGQISTADRQIRMLLARGLSQYFQQLQPDWRGNLVTGYDSVLVPFDPADDKPEKFIGWLNEVAISPELHAYLAQTLASGGITPGRLHRVPVVYGGQYGPDLEEVARQKNMTVEDVIARHTAPTYSVYMVGFAAGFGYMGPLPEELDLPRLNRPRAKVPRGTVALAAGMTGVYPLDMPGGWWLLGYCPLSVFETDCDPPLRFLAGDTVRFYPVNEEQIPEFNEIYHDLNACLEVNGGE